MHARCLIFFLTAFTFYYMYPTRFLPSTSTFRTLYIRIQTICTYQRVSRLQLYFRRARLIDSIRLALRTGSHDTLAPLLNNRDVDSFVVKNALQSAPSPESALSLVELLKSCPRGFVHTETTLLALARILAKSGQVAKLRALVNAINSGKFDNVPKVSFMEQMRWYAVAGEVDQVIGIWEEWKGVRKRMCTQSYNLVMSLYAIRGKDLEAVNIFRSLVDDGARPNPKTYTIIIEHLVNSGKLEPALDVFRMLPLIRSKRTFRQYELLVEAFAGVDRVEIVQSLLDEMRTDGVLPSQAMMLILQRMHQAGYVDWIDELVPGILPNKGIKNVSYSIDSTGGGDNDDDHDHDDDNDEEEDNAGYISGESVDSVHIEPWLDPVALAHALGDWQDEDVAALEGAEIVWTTLLACKIIRSFKRAKPAWFFFCWVSYQPGFTHDIYTISRMITKASLDGCVTIVDQLLSKIQIEGMRLSFSTVRLIIDFYGISCCGCAALRVFQSCKALCGPISETSLLVLYSSLLRTLIQCKMTKEVFDILEEMIMLGMSPDSQTYNVLIHHFARREDLVTVQQLFGMARECGIEPDAHMYKALIRVYCKCNRAALAQRIFEDMINSGLVLDTPTKDFLVKSLWKEGKLREAAAVEERSEEVGVVPRVSTGQLFTVSLTDLTRIYEIYSGSFTSLDDQNACKSNAI